MPPVQSTKFNTSARRAPIRSASSPIPSLPAPAIPDGAAGDQGHHHAAGRGAPHGEPEREPPAGTEPVGDHQRDGEQRRGAETHADQGVGGDHGNERVGAAREEEADPRARRSGDDHDPGLQPVQQPPDERHDEARRERERRLEQRELRAGPAEVIEERGEEDAGGVVARAEDEKQGREEAADHQPGPALAARHAGASTPAFAIGGTRTWVTWGGQGGGNSVPLGSGCRYSPFPGRYAPADAGSAASHAAEPVPNGAGTVRLQAAGDPADRGGWRPGAPA